MVASPECGAKGSRSSAEACSLAGIPTSHSGCRAASTAGLLHINCGTVSGYAEYAIGVGLYSVTGEATTCAAPK